MGKTWNKFYLRICVDFSDPFSENDNFHSLHWTDPCKTKNLQRNTNFSIVEGSFQKTATSWIKFNIPSDSYAKLLWWVRKSQWFFEGWWPKPYYRNGRGGVQDGSTSSHFTTFHISWAFIHFRNLVLLICHISIMHPSFQLHKTIYSLNKLLNWPNDKKNRKEQARLVI